MSYTIIFETNRKNTTIDPIVDKIREVARRDGWAGSDGFIQWAKETYGADLIIGDGWISKWGSISFETQADMSRFKVDFEVDDRARQLREEQKALGPISNKLIRELAEQAGMTIDDNDLMPGETYMLLDEEIEKFAQLIVAECAKVVEAYYWEDDIDGYPADREIKKHFGVEQ